ncbi:MAG: M20/M25/M40 family metallo-hydrolase [Dehalococcoidia bacterium]|nr:M20/M25/M40 family metallo-hydrolase [Dehalococcoidia bacterium]
MSPTPTAVEASLERMAPSVLDETVRITEIPAPTFRECARATYVHDRLAAIGVCDQLAMDGLSNVVAVRRGERSTARTLLSAHLDTVFPDEATPVTRQRDKLIGRGVGDNSLGVAALLGVAEVLQRSTPRGLGDVIFAANVGEEGLGDLRGINRVIKDYGADFEAALVIEGHALNTVQASAVASLRYEVMETEGGHSWGAYGRKNVIALLARAIVALAPIMPEVGVTPKVTMNIGVIRGGRSVNTIAPDAAFELDMRSADIAALGRLHQAGRTAMRVALRGEAELHMKRIGNRPGGAIPEDSTIVRTMLGVRRDLGLPQPEFRASSTDTNALVATGYETTCIGVTTGSESHTPREWIHTTPVRKGVPYVGRALLAVARLPREQVRRRTTSR